jgi:phage gpG-like protein
MADGVRIILSGHNLPKSFAKMDPSRNPKLRRIILLKSAFAIQRRVTKKEIKRGRTGAPLPNRLTFRSGTLTRSIAVAHDGEAVEVGTALIYGAVHENGGTFAIPAHTRRTKSGKRTLVKAHNKTFRKRPFLAPGLKNTQKERLAIAGKEWLKVMNASKVTMPTRVVRA